MFTKEFSLMRKLAFILALLSLFSIAMQVFAGQQEPNGQVELFEMALDKSELNQKIETLRKCHLLFIGSSQKEDSGKIIEALKSSSVLTVGETAGFLEAGSIINFLVKDKKVSFEVNLTAAQKAGLKVRSRLLRLAKRVVEKKVSSQNKNNAQQGRKEQGAKK